ncbi:MAG: heme-binding domain-containing protein [Candidatus Korobacteraceae bacterium]
MLRWAKRIGLAIVVSLVVAQAVPVRHNNPPVERSQTLFAAEKMPAPVIAVLQRSCKNCHSNETVWPWYSYVAPASWIVASDVHNARAQMNFSEWGTYSAKRKEERLEEICEQITNGDMPDPKYALVHRNARITPEERNAVCQWTEDARQY